MEMLCRQTQQISAEAKLLDILSQLLNLRTINHHPGYVTSPGNFYFFSYKCLLVIATKKFFCYFDFGKVHYFPVSIYIRRKTMTTTTHDLQRRMHLAEEVAEKAAELFDHKTWEELNSKQQAVVRSLVQGGFMTTSQMPDGPVRRVAEN